MRNMAAYMGSSRMDSMAHGFGMMDDGFGGKGMLGEESLFDMKKKRTKKNKQFVNSSS